MPERDSVQGAKGSLRYTCLVWQCPTELLNVFGPNGISLTGHLRAPEGWNETQEEAGMPG